MKYDGGQNVCKSCCIHCRGPVYLISAKAKELGIPEWRMKEGFVIADDADEKTIGDYLANVQKNLVTAGLEGKGSGFPMSTPEAQGKELAKAWAETLPDKE